jgi:lipopolysaccharide assembly protein B
VEGEALNNILLFGLIFVALCAAWYLGYINKGKKKLKIDARITKDYFIGLNYLLNDEPDGAIDVFISALELNSNTLETYMALGTLLRRRGKVDRSISVYQDLLAWSELDGDELDRVKVELVSSYIAAGLLDRAEGLLAELQLANTEIKIMALIQGITVYRLEKEWLSAVQVSNELLKICAPDLRALYQTQCSHFYCELAQSEITAQHYASAREYLKKAYQMDKENVRTSLLLGKLEFQLENYKSAIKVLNKVKLQDEQFVAETFPLLIMSYQRAELEKKIPKFIQESLDSQYSSMVLLGIANYIEAESGKGAASDFLMEQLKEKASLRMMSQALLLASSSEVEQKESMLLFHSILSEYIKTRASYKCGNCGFQLKSLHWQCPSCSSWGEVKPDNVIPRDLHAGNFLLNESE